MNYSTKLRGLKLLRQSIISDMNGNSFIFNSNDKAGQETAKRQMNMKRQFQLDRINEQIAELEAKAREEEFQKMLAGTKVDVDTSGIEKALGDAIDRAFKH